jgi:hypothetical protein
MFKHHLNLKSNKMECIKSYNWFQTFCTTKTCDSFYESTCSSGGLDEKPNNNKKFKVLKFWHKRLQAQGLIFLTISI